MKTIYLLLSSNCNLKCKYCFQKAISPEIVGSLDYHRQPRLKASADVITQFVEYCAKNGIQRVEIFGGEPLFYRRAFESTVMRLFECIPHVTVGVITNGTLFNERIMRTFESKPIWILLSLDGGKERHNEMRDGFDKIEPWIPRLAVQGRTTVAMQAAIVDSLYDNICAIWSLGLKRVYINIIENYGWYRADDILKFESEYEQIVVGMLRKEGEATCALQLHEMLKQPKHNQGCGITGEGLACDWHGLLYPCHRAVELGSQFAIGNIFEGIDVEKSRAVRQTIREQALQSEAAKRFPLTSFCPVAIHQTHATFRGDWSEAFCQMIEVKAKIVSKYHYELEKYSASNCRGGEVPPLRSDTSLMLPRP